jgi:hypothetical protein
MNVANMQHISFSFQPIQNNNNDDDSSYSVMEKAAAEIFRDMTMEDTSDKPYTVCRAQPIDSSESETERRVISPFAHSEDRGTPLDWSEEHPCIVDFSLLFEPNTFASHIDLMDCQDDDFSLSSREATSMCQDLESITEDPSSFWESSVERCSSPNDISLNHSADESL